MPIFITGLEEQKIAHLEHEWHAVTSVLREEKRQQLAESVQQWEARMLELLTEQQQLVQEGKWFRGPADLLSVIGRDRQETYHSKMLAWLMDPLAPHGLGDLFLRAFMELCEPDWTTTEDLGNIRVQCEVSRARSRTDIVVWTDSFTLIIENKIHAAEQEHQCYRIFQDFREDADPRFVFLTLTGYPPDTAQEAFDAFRLLDYRRLANRLVVLLESTPPSSRSATGRATVDNYLETLRVML